MHQDMNFDFLEKYEPFVSFMCKFFYRDEIGKRLTRHNVAKGKS